MLPRNVLIALLCCFLAMQNVIVASQQLLLVLLGRIRLLRIMETLTQLLNRRRRRRRFHPYWTFPRPVESWFEIHMHQRTFPEAFFRRHLRMGRESFDNLLTLLRGYVLRENTRFRDCIPPEKVLAIGLYRIAHGGSYDNTALAMNVGKTTVHEAFRDVVNALYDIRNDFIKLPVTVDETAASIGTFEHLSMLPNIAGAIDGSHIKIRAPRESAVDYFSRYQQHDVVVQAVVVKCYKITTSENLVNLIVERRLFKITTALFTIPVFLFLVFVNEIFYLSHTLIHCAVSLEFRIQIINNFGPHFTGIFTFQLVVVLFPQIDQVLLFGVWKCLIFSGFFPLTRSCCAFTAFFETLLHRSAGTFDLRLTLLKVLKVEVLWLCLWLWLVAVELRSVIVNIVILLMFGKERILIFSSWIHLEMAVNGGFGGKRGHAHIILLGINYEI